MNKDDIQLHEMAELPGVTIRTLQRWDNAVIFKAGRTPANRRFYTYDPYLACTGQKSDERTDDRKTAICPTCGYTEDRDFNAAFHLKDAEEYVLI